MTRLPCQYAVIRFLPYAETGEFANVGVVLACPATGFFGTRLIPARKTGRITGFFEQLDIRIFRESLRYLDQELDRVLQVVAKLPAAAPESVRRLFEDLIHPREALLRFGDARVVLADAPETMLDTLFERFVERDFASKEYHDRMLERGVRETLRKANLGQYFERAEIGNDDLHIQLPFVHTREGRPVLAIKPLDLAKNEANKVFDVGGHWLARVERFRKHGLLPEKTLFAVKLPDPADTRSRMAADEIVTELGEKGGILVAKAQDSVAIAKFAGAAAH